MITGKWAFDVIYEFVYQFQEACQYRASAVRDMSEGDVCSVCMCVYACLGLSV